MPVLLKNLLGMKFRTVDGYKGSNDVVLAMQRNEVGGICQTVTAFAQSAQNMLDDGTVRMLFTTEKRARCRAQGADHLRVSPRPTSSATSSTFHASSLETGRPWLAPPERAGRAGRGACAAPSTPP